MKKHNMKRFLLLLCMLVCVFSMTACTNTISSQDAKDSSKQMEVDSNTQDIKTWTTDMITYLDKTSDDAIKADAEAAKDLSAVNHKEYAVNPDGMDSKTIEFYNSWIKSREDLGKLKSINDCQITISSKTKELCTVTVKTTFEKRDCSFEIVINSDMGMTSGAINPTFTLGEKMEKAILNTILGMGTVFIVLIFISFVISQLKHLNKIGKKSDTDKTSEPQSQGVDNGIAQIVSNEEDETDDLELVAVITAAIAAAEGTSSDGLVVRSIKKVNKSNNWRR